MTLVFLFILGTIVGSFLNVCIFRMPRNQSIVSPRSRCPNCARPLGILDLVPILSYLFLRGRCRYCGRSISLRYPLVELIAGLIFPGLYLHFGFGLDFVFYVFLFSILIIIFFIDLESQIIPDVLAYLGMGSGLIFNLVKGQIIPSLVGMAGGFAFMWLLRRVATYFYKQEAMGEGDVYLAALMGAGLGWQNLILALFLSYLIGSAVGVYLIIFKRSSLRSAIPFGPMMVLGTGIAALFGSQIWQVYFGMLLR